MSPVAEAPRVSPAHARLRHATAEFHARLDASLRLGKPGAGRAHYARYVAAMWGWLEPLEARLWEGPWPAQVAPAERAVKLDWLSEDLAHAQADGYSQAASLARCEPAIELAGLPDRIGVAYVIEGSLRGASVLRRRVGPALAPWPARFLAGYGAQAGARWRDFLAVMASELRTEAAIGQAERSAAWAFASIEGWLRERGAA
jgi:heme oxygenase